MINLRNCVLALAILTAATLVSQTCAHAQTTGPLVQSAPALKTLLTIDPHKDAPRNSEGDIIKLSDGRLALVYTKFSGGTQDESEAHLAMRTSADGGKTWTTDTVALPNEGGRNVMSVSLVPSRDSGIMLFYLRKDTSHTSCTMFVRRSYDDLKTLSEPVVVTTLPGYHVVNNDRVLRLKSGRLLVPSALHTDFETTISKFSPKAAMIVYYSDDDGRTWNKDSSPVPPLPERELVLQEPGLVELSDGTVLMYIRTGHGYQYFSESSDQGISWSKPMQSNLASPRSPATIERLPDTNKLVIIWNDHSGQHPYAEENRTPLCLAIVDEDDRTTPTSIVLEPDPNGWYCYTSMTFVEDRLILSYCAGQGRKDGLNRLKVAELPLPALKSGSSF